MLVGSHPTTRRHPGDARTRHAEHFSGVAERRICLQTVRLWHAALVHRDQAVLDHAQRNLVLNLFDAESRRPLVLDDETLDLAVSDVARPDDRNVTPGSVADPLL